MDRKQRKNTRLPAYDYSENGVYFVTICTKDRRSVLSNVCVVGEGLRALPQIELTPIGEVVEQSIRYLQQHIPGVAVDQYVIMPNHVHMLVRIFETGGHRGPPLQKIIGQFKSYTTHCYKTVLWQRSFHDHVVRGEQDYRDVWRYIDQNPHKWQEDPFFIDE